MTATTIAQRGEAERRDEAAKRPRPAVDPDSSGFWQAARDGVFTLSQCTRCGRWEHPPREQCSNCGGAMTMRQSTGRGTVYSYIVLHHNTIPGFTDVIPYAIALVEFEGNCRLPARVQGEFDRDTLIGSTVQVEFEQFSTDQVPALLVRVVDA